MHYLCAICTEQHHDAHNDEDSEEVSSAPVEPPAVDATFSESNTESNGAGNDDSGAFESNLIQSPLSEESEANGTESSEQQPENRKEVPIYKSLVLVCLIVDPFLTRVSGMSGG